MSLPCGHWTRFRPKRRLWRLRSAARMGEPSWRTLVAGPTVAIARGIVTVRIREPPLDFLPQFFAACVNLVQPAADERRLAHADCQSGQGEHTCAGQGADA